MDAVVVGSIGGLVQANIDASWLLVPMISGPRATVPARAASSGWLGSRSTPYVSPYAKVGVVEALLSCSRPAARRSCRWGSDLTWAALTPSRFRKPCASH